MCRILFGAENVGPNCYMTSLININSPLTFDSVMMGSLEVYARAGQAVLVSPFIVGGAMAPVSVAGTLTQLLAEAMVGIAYAQLVNPGCPVIFGAFVTSIDMNSGAPTFGTPEASKILWGAGQLARRLNLPFRSGGALCASKLPDAQAAYESANTLQAALVGGVNFMLHACGWLEGGLVSGYEKFVLDADQLGVLHSLAEGIDLSENGQAMDAIREVGPGGHFLGCAHTQANFKDAFWRTQVLDYRPFETWAEAGEPEFDAAGQCAGAEDARRVRGAGAGCGDRRGARRSSWRGGRRRSRTPSGERAPGHGGDRRVGHHGLDTSACARHCRTTHDVCGRCRLEDRAMASASFTHRMDPDLKAELEKIARFDDRSASYIANMAIRAFVEERQATRELVIEGLRQVEAGAPSVPADEVQDWLLADDDRPFPEGRKAR